MADTTENFSRDCAIYKKIYVTKTTTTTTTTRHSRQTVGRPR